MKVVIVACRVGLGVMWIWVGVVCLWISVLCYV